MLSARALLTYERLSGSHQRPSPGLHRSLHSCPPRMACREESRHRHMSAAVSRGKVHTASRQSCQMCTKQIGRLRICSNTVCYRVHSTHRTRRIRYNMICCLKSKHGRRRMNSFTPGGQSSARKITFSVALTTMSRRACSCTSGGRPDCEASSCFACPTFSNIIKIYTMESFDKAHQVEYSIETQEACCFERKSCARR